MRNPSKGMLFTIWIHEYFAVYKNKVKSKAKRELDIYQVIEFRIGGDMPPQCKLGLSEKELAQVWVLGVYYAPAARIRRANQFLLKDRYIFQKDTALDWEPAVQYRTEMGNCPELVMVTNCTMWHPMCDVLQILPRVVHPVDVQTHRVYVNGRDWHYVCGVKATELSFSPQRKRSCASSDTAACGFALSMIDRKHFCMYPEERLGGLINSPTSQWDHVDELFQGMRNVMSCETGFVSGSFIVSWTNACQRFWAVSY